jgi:hypothetical protein
MHFPWAVYSVCAMWGGEGGGGAYEGCGHTRQDVSLLPPVLVFVSSSAYLDTVAPPVKLPHAMLTPPLSRRTIGRRKWRIVPDHVIYSSSAAQSRVVPVSASGGC